MKGVIIAIVVLALAGVGYYFFVAAPTTQAPEGEQMMQKAETMMPSSVKTTEDKESGEKMMETGGAMMGAETKAAIKNFAFGPGELRMKAGGKAMWTNEDVAGHTVTADDGSWGSKTLSQGKSFSQEFAKKGTFAYHCELHPSMKGTVIVE